MRKTEREHPVSGGTGADVEGGAACAAVFAGLLRGSWLHAGSWSWAQGAFKLVHCVHGVRTGFSSPCGVASGTPPGHSLKRDYWDPWPLSRAGGPGSLNSSQLLEAVVYLGANATQGQAGAQNHTCQAPWALASQMRPLQTSARFQGFKFQILFLGTVA